MHAPLPNALEMIYTVGRRKGQRWHYRVKECVWSMRAVDDSSVKYAAVLQLLLTWKQLPESDITRMLRHYYFVTDDFREMEDQGLLTMAFIGDEYIITPTLLGRIWLEEYTVREKTHGL